MPAESRRPRQERGQRRVEAILDAAAEMIAEVGIAGATVQGIATRARTAIGSMYHFFPDRESVLRALGERHVVALRAVVASLLGADPTLDWARLTAGEAADRFVDPILAYLRRHPDLLALIGSPGPSDRDAELDALLAELAETVVQARTPDATPPERSARAAAMLGIMEGVLLRAARTPPPERAALLRELKHAIAVYLGSYEAAPPPGEAVRSASAP